MRRLAVVILTVWAGGCAPSEPEASDPLASLSSPEPSGTFPAEYWSSEAEAATSTWKEALAYCQEEGRRLLPNCETVSHVHFLSVLRSSAERRSKPYTGEGTLPFPDLVVRTLETGTDTLSAAFDEDPPPVRE